MTAGTARVLRSRREIEAAWLREVGSSWTNQKSVPLSELSSGVKVAIAWAGLRRSTSMVSMSRSPPTTIIPASEQHAVSSVAGLGFGSLSAPPQ